MPKVGNTKSITPFKVTFARSGVFIEKNTRNNVKFSSSYLIPIILEKNFYSDWKYMKIVSQVLCLHYTNNQQVPSFTVS